MPGTRWTQEEIGLLKENYPRRDVTVDEISKLTGHPRMGVMLKASALGLYKKWSPQEKDLLVQMWSNPVVTVREICERLKRDKSSIYPQVRFLRLTRPSIPKRSVGWTEEQVEYLRQHYQSYDYEVLCSYLGKSERAIYNMAKKLGVPPRPYGTRRPERNRQREDKLRLLEENQRCEVDSCVGWEKALDLHHEKDRSLHLLCANHHALLTRGFAKFIDGKYTLL
jgi:hypothetical protein